jgi:predicted sugar kinase
VVAAICHSPDNYFFFSTIPNSAEKKEKGMKANEILKNAKMVTDLDIGKLSSMVMFLMSY